MINKCKYDTLLFGNGLTLSILNDIQENCFHLLNKQERRLCNQNDFIAHLLCCPVNSPTYNGLLRICTHDSSSDYEIYQIIKAHEKAKEEFNQVDILSGQKHVDYIRENGFEAWGGLHCFDKETSIYKRNKELVYSINNYWFYLFRKKVLSKPEVKKIVWQTSQKVLHFQNRLTLNFDTIVDWLCPIEHLHGSFVSDFERWGDLLYFTYGINLFEYPYIFGTNAFEKQDRINRIQALGKEGDYYRLSFFYDDERYYGDLLIYGISFSESNIKLFSSIPSNLVEQSYYYHNCLDGHILSRLSYLQRTGKVRKITITSYKKSEVERYRRLIGLFNLEADVITDMSIINELFRE